MDETILQKANQLEKDYKWIEASIEYKKILVNGDRDPTLYERIAWCLSRAAKYSEAIEYLNILIEISPQSAKWPYMIGYQYYCQKKWQESASWFERSLNLFPDYFVVKYRLAYAYIQIAGIYKKLTKAEYWKALGLLQDCHRLWNFFDENKKNKEISTYFDINFLHGKILMDLPNHRDEAVNLFTQALIIKPSDEYAKYNLARTYYLIGDYQNAKKNLPKSSQYFVIELSAYINAKLGETRDAINSINLLTKQRKKDYLFCFLAEVYLQINDVDEAYKMARKAIKLGSINHKNYFVMAKVYYRYGLFQLAINNLEKANKLKNEKYNSSFIECETMKEEILKKIPQNYFDDNELLAKLASLDSNNESKINSDCVIGIIKKFDNSKGYGFISCDSQDIFCHISNFKYKEINIGDKVTFETINSPKGKNALNIRKCNG